MFVLYAPFCCFEPLTCMLFRDATNISDSQPPATCRQRYVSVYGIVTCTLYAYTGDVSSTQNLSLSTSTCNDSTNTTRTVFCALRTNVGLWHSKLTGKKLNAFKMVMQRYPRHHWNSSGFNLMQLRGEGGSSCHRGDRSPNNGLICLLVLLYIVY